jgi:hypothetical protein
MNSTVAIVFNESSAIAIEAIARCMPVWIASTPSHDQVKDELKGRGDSVPLTWFPLRNAESFEEAAIRIAYSLDDHYNEAVVEEGYKFLLVYGVEYDFSMFDQLKELGFSVFEKTAFGFAARKI